VEVFFQMQPRRVSPQPDLFLADEIEAVENFRIKERDCHYFYILPELHMEKQFRPTCS
jgi:hypothetical protein